ncbi:hypothetical protein B0T13DRAFT_473844 [Neurospora crassa]|nr:hypothetical protein B0T13DRAFT_473844 [Neurospora crassa]
MARRSGVNRCDRQTVAQDAMETLPLGVSLQVLWLATPIHPQLIRRFNGDTYGSRRFFVRALLFSVTEGSPLVPLPILKWLVVVSLLTFEVAVPRYVALKIYMGNVPSSLVLLLLLLLLLLMLLMLSPSTSRKVEGYLGLCDRKTPVSKSFGFAGALWQ